MCIYIYTFNVHYTRHDISTCFDPVPAGFTPGGHVGDGQGGVELDIAWAQGFSTCAPRVPKWFTS